MRLALGSLRFYVRLEQPTSTTDAFGSYSEAWAALNPPDAWCAITASAGRTGERRIANTAVAQATFEVLMRYHPQVTTAARIRWTDQAGTARVLSVVDVENIDEAGDALRLSCVEVTTA